MSKDLDIKNTKKIEDSLAKANGSANISKQQQQNYRDFFKSLLKGPHDELDDNFSDEKVVGEIFSRQK